ncbi:hypothetical protein [Luteimonas kalidii]|uniref:Uncharacterized protein n=1 Tax=Luteimonas kalidii TaxID=3042025 RepID=A0ABT6JWM9_9GAMM|nr:hypothetical protein [Luteimonas kalidii]MDH5834898.1 hypothetical protein [Luteimonas kalidii]
MNGNSGYAVFFYPQALEALGEAIKPYLQEGEAGPHISCSEVDTAGAFVEMTMFGRTAEGQDVTLELMVPSSMVRMIVSSQQAGSFGFRPHGQEGPVVTAATTATTTATATSGTPAGAPTTPVASPGSVPGPA